MNVLSFEESVILQTSGPLELHVLEEKRVLADMLVVPLGTYELQLVLQLVSAHWYQGP